MAATLIDGKRIARAIRRECAEECAQLAQRGVVPSLTVILAGDDPASQIYVRNKEKACAECGIRSEVIRLPGDVSQEALLSEIARVNADPSIHGLLMQLPLPARLDERAALMAIDPEKDVDGFHPMNAGALISGAGDPFLPCTPAGCMELLRRAQVPLSGKRAAVVGRSAIVGKPMALLLLAADCTVTVCHSRTQDLAQVLRQADVVVAAVGKPRLITGDMLKAGAVVIDVGINRLPDGSLCGDVDFDSASQVAGWITPVPGGVGPMTIAMLMKNTIKAAKRHAR